MASSSNRSSDRGKGIMVEVKGEKSSEEKFWFDPKLVYAPMTLYEEDRLAKLYVGPTKKVVVCPFAPHLGTMRELGIFRKVDKIFKGVGLPNWNSLMSGPTYNKLVVEFFATFFRGAGDDYSCNSWIFNINNKLLVADVGPIREFLFGDKEKVGEYPSCTEEERLYVWRQLTDMEVYSPTCSTRCLKEGHWLYIHQLIGTHFNTREDGASQVSRDDLDILYYMYNEHPINWFDLITERIRRMASYMDRDLSLGCTSIITRLAQFLGWNFCHQYDGFYELDMRTLTGLELYDQGRRNWIYEPSLRK